MNANELADELESCRDYELPEFVHKTATMLRQQQAEIEALKADSKRLDWIWSNRDYFVLKGIELFTETTQHFKNAYGIRPMIDEAIELEVLRKAQEK
jgi:hypothetical protein